MDNAHSDLIENIKRTFAMLLKEVDHADVQINETFDKGKWATIMISAAKEGSEDPMLQQAQQNRGIPRLLSPFTEEDEEDEE